MTLPATAKVEATPNFLATLDDAHAFFVAQDAESADARFRNLKAKLREMVAILAWSPASGRPARFFETNSAQAKLRAAAIAKLAQQTGLPDLREYIVDQHIVLYAHSPTLVVLLALKHQRQLIYGAEP
jgi:hypothetical protein